MKNFSDLKYALNRYGESVKIFFRHIAPKCEQSEMIIAIASMFDDFIIDLPEIQEDWEGGALVIKVTLCHSHEYDYGKRYDTHVFNVILRSKRELHNFMCIIKNRLRNNTQIEIVKFVYYSDTAIFMPYVEQEYGHTIITINRNPEL